MLICCTRCFFVLFIEGFSSRILWSCSTSCLKLFLLTDYMLLQVKTRLTLQMRNMPMIRLQTSNIILSFLGCFFSAPNQSGNRRAAGNWALAYRNVLNHTFHRKLNKSPSELQNTTNKIKIKRTRICQI
ncbi:hypothetical protein NC652_035331 [Populus alba x Populus x berolinensis]|nr:hypothetical protein NC652_035331 [Populus alba x Populus x berolinensis]